MNHEGTSNVHFDERTQSFAPRRTEVCTFAAGFYSRYARCSQPVSKGGAYIYTLYGVSSNRHRSGNSVLLWVGDVSEWRFCFSSRDLKITALAASCPTNVMRGLRRVYNHIPEYTEYMYVMSTCNMCVCSSLVVYGWIIEELAWRLSRLRV